MKPSSRRLSRVLLTLAPVAVFLGGFGWLTYAHVQRAKLKPLLIEAVKAEDAARVRDLLNRGADPNARDRPTTEPMGLRGLIPSLLGRDLDTRSNRGKTALMLAADNDDLESVKLLLDQGANPNARDDAGCTALIHTVRVTGQAACVKLLLDYGADVNIQSRGHLFRASVWMYATDLGSDFNPASHAGVTALLLAAAHNRTDLITLLLNHGADVNIRPDCGMTPLGIAMRYEAAPSIALLKKYGAKE